MGMRSSVVRLARVRQKIRMDLWPDAPQLPESFIRRFPELQEFNEELKLFVERMRNATEPDPENFTNETECQP